MKLWRNQSRVTVLSGRLRLPDERPWEQIYFSQLTRDPSLKLLLAICQVAVCNFLDLDKVGYGASVFRIPYANFRSEYGLIGISLSYAEQDRSFATLRISGEPLKDRISALRVLQDDLMGKINAAAPTLGIHEISWSRQI